MKKWRLDLVMLAICVAWAVVVLPRMFTGRWSPGAEAAITWVGGLLRLTLVAVAAVAAALAVRSLDTDNPARNSQSLLAGGFAIYLLAQGTIFVLTLTHGGTPPYPSVADLGFFAAMFLLIAGVASGIRSWLALGLFPHGGRRAAAAAILAAVPLAVGVAFTIRSLAGAASTPLQEAADIAYPVLDSILLVLIVAMLSLTALLGKGTVGAVWRSLLLGFLAMAVGDVVYSFFAGFNLDVLDPVLDVLYTAAYALMARGALLQLQLLRE
jgi:hypothetical protein